MQVHYSEALPVSTEPTSFSVKMLSGSVLKILFFEQSLVAILC